MGELIIYMGKASINLGKIRELRIVYNVYYCLSIFYDIRGDFRTFIRLLRIFLGYIKCAGLKHLFLR